MQLGYSGPCVRTLQTILNARGFIVSTTGAGSPGNETNYFGPATTNALARYQASVGISPAVGYFGPITRTRMSAN
jgi:peptidoglycan hydrolase-like protein with peptidoglycan-binding domain